MSTPKIKPLRKESEIDMLGATDIGQCFQIHRSRALQLMKQMPGYMQLGEKTHKVPRWGVLQWQKARSEQQRKIHAEAVNAS